VLLVAADTFRAAAVAQLSEWASRLSLPVVTGADGAKPATVVFDAMQRSATEEFDIIIIDTAGRLHTRHNLMEELRKVQRVVGKKDGTAPHEIFLVVDATTGGNALQQAREFHKAVPLTGLIVTKLDGSGKGGVLVAIPLTRNLGLLVLGPIIVNILCFHVFLAKFAYIADPVLITICVLAAFLLWAERKVWSGLLGQA
jgi:signal recognition particle GTPase